METILQGLLDLQGVTAAMVLDHGGQVLGHRGNAVHDRATCQAVAGELARAVESVALQQEDWEAVTAHFADGRLLVRNLRDPAGPGHLLAVVADGALNASFATVALRVATNKLRRVLGGGAAGGSSALPVGGGSSAVAPAGAGSSVAAAASSHALPSGEAGSLSNTGLTWSRAGSSAAVSRVAAADPASMAFLTRAAKELARHVGPIAKVMVQESVQRVAPDAPFALAAAPALVEELARQIEAAEDREAFRTALSRTSP